LPRESSEESFTSLGEVFASKSLVPRFDAETPSIWPPAPIPADGVARRLSLKGGLYQSPYARYSPRMPALPVRVTSPPAKRLTSFTSAVSSSLILWGVESLRYTEVGSVVDGLYSVPGFPGLSPRHHPEIVSAVGVLVLATRQRLRRKIRLPRLSFRGRGRKVLDRYRSRTLLHVQGLGRRAALPGVSPPGVTGAVAVVQLGSRLRKQLSSGGLLPRR